MWCRMESRKASAWPGLELKFSGTGRVASLCEPSFGVFLRAVISCLREMTSRCLTCCVSRFFTCFLFACLEVCPSAPAMSPAWHFLGGVHRRVKMFVVRDASALSPRAGALNHQFFSGVETRCLRVLHTAWNFVKSFDGTDCVPLV